MMNDTRFKTEDRFTALVGAWLGHCQEVGHDRETARHDCNLAYTYIKCCVRGCKWEHELKP